MKRADIEELDRAIWSQVCPYCGARKNQACKQKSRDAGPNSSTKTPHMARVRAGHAALKRT